MFIFLSLIHNSFSQDLTALKPRVVINTIVYIASPRKNCERGIGLCGHTDVLIELRRAQAGWGRSEGSVYLIFNADELSSSLLDEFETHKSFEVGTDVVLDEKTCQALQLPSQSAIRAGNYPLIYDRSDYLIKIPVQ